MKLQLEFEDDDLREMIEEYFGRNGFKVKNLDQLCELFSKAYPDGITVQAETLPANATLPAREVQEPDAEPDEGYPEPAEAVELTEAEDPTPEKVHVPKQTVMTATDLFDPTPGNVPTRDEQLRQSQQEVAYLVEQSKALEEEKAKDT